MVAYAELQIASNYSFLRGGSHPQEYAARAAELGYAAFAITDRNTLAGVVRAYVGVNELNARRAPAPATKFVVGARLDLQDGPSLLAYPTDRPAYGRLTRLLTVGNRRAPKGRCLLAMADLEEFSQGLMVAVAPPRRPADPAFLAALDRLAGIYRRRCWLAASTSAHGRDQRRLTTLAEIAARHRTPLLATNDVHYHVPERRALQDVLTAIRLGCTVDEAGWRLFANAERHMKEPQEMARLFRRHPQAIERTLEIAEACAFSLKQLEYQYPTEDGGGGETPQQRLERLAWIGAAKRYPAGVPEDVQATIRKELALIEQCKYAPYFLTVHHIVEYARGKGILCQGRGSAANSVVCYCLGVTAIDPKEIDLLFERFISSSRGEPPDIDVDFEHERREEVIQHIYDHYGRDSAALAATLITYRTRSAVREVGKAMGLSPDTVGVLADTVWGSGSDAIPPERVREAGLDPDDRRLATTLALAAQLVGFPRHLSQHVGGFVIVNGRLDDLVPIQNAAMEDRLIVEWDKDDLDALKILKVDVLALGMLTCLRKGFALIEQQTGERYELASVPQDDGDVYDMICKADTLGVFQIESRAQMSMLPRLKPRKLYDLVIEVAIVRPGPIQGNMVHPYLRRRDGLEPETYPSEALRQVLSKTRGVPLFQEQAMKIAIVAAGFSPDEADQLRRAMATFRNPGTIHNFRGKMIEGMVERGYEREFAERCFKQIEGFGSYGFPESHAASFALLAYVSSWIKCRYPAAFAAALLNSQPMGFYAPAQIVRDAREHGVEVRPVDVNRSGWDYALEAGDGERPATPSDAAAPAIRMGFRQIKGLPEELMTAFVARRGEGYRTVEELAWRGRLERRHIEALARADAFGSLGLSRRATLWAARAPGDGELPLFDPARRNDGAEPLRREPEVALPEMRLGEQIVEDYGSLTMSLKRHPLSLLRAELDRRGVVANASLGGLRDGARVAVAGLVLVRQRPGSANGVVFVTLEDETGVSNLVLWQAVFERFRKVAMTARMVEARGRLQSQSGVIHVVVDRLVDLSPLLDTLAAREGSLAHNPLPHRARDIVIPPYAPADAARTDGGDHRVRKAAARGKAIEVRSRDFH